MVRGRHFVYGYRVNETWLAKPQLEGVRNGSVEVKMFRGNDDRRLMFSKTRLTVPGFVPICGDVNDPESAVCGCLKRVCMDNLPKDPEFLARLAKNSAAEADQLLLRANYHRLSFVEWLSLTSYSAKRKEQLIATHARLRGHVPSVRDLQIVRAFGKLECYTEIKHVRGIYPRNDKAKVTFGPLCKSIELLVFHNSRHFVKGMTNPQKAQRIAQLNRPGMRYYSVDFTSFEGQCEKCVMQNCEMILYRKCDQSKECVLMEQVMLGTNKIVFGRGRKKKFEIQIEGRRMSGEMCTSLGNGWTNYMIAKTIIEEKLGHVDGDDLRWDGIFEGDDSLIAVPFELTAEDFLRHGFKVKECVESPTPFDAKFCCLIVAEDGTVLRDPVKFFGKFGWTHQCVLSNDHTMDTLLRAQALSAAYETPQCPIVGAIARHALAVTRGVLPRFTPDGYHLIPPDEFVVPDFAPSIAARAKFAQHFGVCPETQVELERRITSGDLSMIKHVFRPSVDHDWFEKRYVT
jgi:hypothetical protein